MRYDSLKVTPKSRATSAWANSVIDALNELYGWVTSGQQDINARTVDALYGYIDYLQADRASFTTRPIAEGKPVILDGDPVSIYDISSYVQNKITTAIDSSKVASEATLQSLYGVESYTKDLVLDIRNKVVSVRVDEYGNVGVVVAEPIDEYGRVLVRTQDPDSELLDVTNEIVITSGSGSQIVLTPPSGKSVDIRRAYLATSSSPTSFARIALKFQNSGKVIAVIYPNKYGYIEIPEIRIAGNPDDPVVLEWSGLSSGDYIYYTINYKII